MIFENDVDKRWKTSSIYFFILLCIKIQDSNSVKIKKKILIFTANLKKKTLIFRC